jgi:hypothetical protein
LNGAPDFDRKNPWCFCFDCRGAFDPRAEVDSELLNNGHPRACEAYASLLTPPSPPLAPTRTMSPPPAPRKITPDDVLAERDAIRASCRLAHSANSSGWVNSSPSCSCTTCRDIYDPTGQADADAANASSRDAALPPPPLNLTRQTGYVTTAAPVSPPFSARSPSLTPPPVPTLATRTNGGGLGAIVGISTEQPKYANFSEIPMSLPAPRARDIMNESPAERLKNDLADLRADIMRDLVLTMDKQRNAICVPEADRPAFLRSIRDEEDVLWSKLDAVERLLRD